MNESKIVLTLLKPSSLASDASSNHINMPTPTNKATPDMRWVIEVMAVIGIEIVPRSRLTGRLLFTGFITQVMALTRNALHDASERLHGSETRTVK
jgi:hypothetical protein